LTSLCIRKVSTTFLKMSSFIAIQIIFCWAKW
jgi:hypothetical protein